MKRFSPGRVSAGTATVSGAILAVLLGWYGLVQLVEREKSEAIAAAAAANANLARAFGEHVLGMLRQVDLVSVTIASEVARKGLQAVDLDAYQRDLTSKFPYIIQVAAADASGYTLPKKSIPERYYVGNREHFFVHVAEDTGRLHVGKPVIGRMTGKWSIEMTRRLNDPGGAFAGVLAISFNPEYFTRFYQAVSLGEKGLVTLVRDDGIVIARRTSDSVSIGADIHEAPWFQKRKAERVGWAITDPVLDNTKRIVAFDSLVEYPLMVIVGTSLDEVLTPEHNRSLTYHLFGLGLTALLLLVASMVAWSFVRQERVNRSLAESRDRTEVLLSEKEKAEFELLRLNAELEDRVARRTAELERANRSMESFSYSVSHDLRAPLRAMIGFSELLLIENGHKLDAGALDHLRRIQAGAARMNELIQDLLELSRVSRRALTKEDFDLSSIAAQCVDFLRQGQPARRVVVAIQPGMAASGDPGLMRIALENLIGNAWKFTSRVGEARIEIGMTEQDGTRTYFVKDNGAGFDMKYADRLFAPFQRLHRTDEFEGTGIGLSIVQRIVDRHGGKVWAEAKEGEGATFYFTLV